MDPDKITSTFKNYDRKSLIWPTAGKLSEYRNVDNYDESIAVWTDYFNEKFGANPPLDPDVIKALLASESGFRLDPKENKQAFGIAQITKDTWKTLQDPNGEEVILEYKGLLKSKSDYKDRALAKFREAYARLKKK